MSTPSSDRSHIEYRFPPVSEAEVAVVMAAYTELTGRQVWPSMRGQFIAFMRRFGPDFTAMMTADIETNGVTDMITRFRALSGVAPTADLPAPERPIAATPSGDERLHEVDALVKRFGGLDGVPRGLLDPVGDEPAITPRQRYAHAAQLVSSMDADAYDDLVDQLTACLEEREAS